MTTGASTGPTGPSGPSDGASSSAGVGAGAGSAAQEATRLFEAVQEWARRASTDGRTMSEHWTEHIATGSPECRLCPVCQLIGMLRETRPEVAMHLADAAGSVLAAVRSALLAHEREWTARRAGGVERIDIS